MGQGILEEDLARFIAATLPPPDELLTRIYAYAEANHVPVIAPEAGNFLALLTALLRPARILEIGTAIGCSAIYMLRAWDEGELTTIELSPERARVARENFAAAGLTERVTLIEGDAREIFAALDGPYDLIFMDAAKGQYGEFLTQAYDKLTSGGVVVADNVLLNGWVVNLDYPHRRHKTFVLRMKALLESFAAREDYQLSLLPLGDGLALFRKKECSR